MQTAMKARKNLKKKGIKSRQQCVKQNKGRQNVFILAFNSNLVPINEIPWISALTGLQLSFYDTL